MIRKSLAVALLLVSAAFATQLPTDGVIVRQAPVPALEALPVGPGTLFGKAIERESSAPLSEARVIVRWLGPQTGANSFAMTQYGRVLTTDADGAFVVPAIPYGNYVVDVSKAGYTDGDSFIAGGSRRTMQVTDDAPTQAEQFLLSRVGTLEGMVVDEGGQPLPDHAVMLYRRRTADSPLTLPEVARALTGPDGRFRFTGVPPSSYIVGLDFRVTTIPASLTEMRTALSTDDVSRLDGRLAESRVPRTLFSIPTVAFGDFRVFIENGGRRQPRVEVSDGRIVTTASTYAPDVTSFADAELHTVTAGQQVTGVNITVRKQAGARVSGTLTGPSGATAYVGVRLVADGAADIERATVGDAALTVTDINGNFTFLGVPPGRYDLEVAVLGEPSVRLAPTMRPELQR